MNLDANLYVAKEIMMMPAYDPVSAYEYYRMQEWHEAAEIVINEKGRDQSERIRTVLLVEPVLKVS